MDQIIQYENEYGENILFFFQKLNITCIILNILHQYINKFK